MDPATASYYRAILFQDSQDQRPLPQTLVRIHQWAFKRCQSLGIGNGVISKQTAFAVAMMWLGSTSEGRAFAREHMNIGDLLIGPIAEETVASAVSSIDWDAVQAETPVTVMIDKKPTLGTFVCRRGSWVDIQVGTEIKSYRTNQVQLVAGTVAGA